MIQFFHEQRFVAGHHGGRDWLTRIHRYWFFTLIFNDPMTTANQTPREVIESFIKDMSSAFEKYRPNIEKLEKAIQDIKGNTKKKQKSPEEYEEELDEADDKLDEVLKSYRFEQSKVLEKYSISIPKDFFISRSSGCIYVGDKVIKEEISKGKFAKVFTETHQFIYEQHKIYVLQLKDDQWAITGIRRVDQSSKKDEKLSW